MRWGLVGGVEKESAAAGAVGTKWKQQKAAGAGGKQRKPNRRPQELQNSESGRTAGGRGGTTGMLTYASSVVALSEGLNSYPRWEQWRQRVHSNVEGLDSLVLS